MRRVFLASALFAHWQRWASRTAEDALRELFPGDDRETRRLRGYLSGLWIDAGCPPNRMSFFMLAATTVGFPHEGGAYPTGGSDAMALALAAAIEARGGRVLVRAEVASIVVEGERVRGVLMADGSRLAATTVISAAGYRTTAERLLPKDAALRHGLDGRALRTAQSDGFVMCNFAIHGSADALGIGCSNLWLQPCGAATGHSFEAGIEAYLDRPLSVPPDQVPLMLTFPSVKDRGWHGAHPEQTMCQSLALAPWSWFARFHDAENGQPPRHAPPHVSRVDQRAYDELKAAWAERTRQVLVEHYPLVSGKIEFVDVSTPLTIEHFLPSGRGSAIGLDVTPERFVDADVIRRLDMRSTISGLWLTGQDVLMCGQPLAQLSGIITALRVAGPLRATGLVCRILLQRLGMQS